MRHWAEQGTRLGLPQRGLQDMKHVGRGGRRCTGSELERERLRAWVGDWTVPLLIAALIALMVYGAWFFIAW
ncbi:MAG: hypothetical protein IH606_05155 [Burkholderiales bacterium]|nr:hypothetical protein [Burkholderiales bacterium]